MPKEHTLFEKSLILLLTLSLIGFFSFKTGSLKEICDYILSGSILLNMVSKTSRFWNLINSKTRLVWCLAIVLVILGGTMYIYHHQLIWLISFLAGVILFTTSMTSIYRRLTNEEVKENASQIND